MVRVIFYEKPGCINNAKQKALLWKAGHEVISHNLLKTPWTTPTLRPFFGDRPVTEWFNQTAPAVKSGEVIPEKVSPEMALTLMIANPLLIRRPLLQVGQDYQVGFDYATIDAWINLKSYNPLEDLETCPRA